MRPRIIYSTGGGQAFNPPGVIQAPQIFLCEFYEKETILQGCDARDQHYYI